MVAVDGLVVDALVVLVLLLLSAFAFALSSVLVMAVVVTVAVAIAPVSGSLVVSSSSSSSDSAGVVLAVSCGGGVNSFVTVAAVPASVAVFVEASALAAVEVGPDDEEAEGALELDAI